MSSAKLPLVYQRYWLMLCWLWVLAVCVLSVIPRPPVPDLALLSWDKLNHTLAYAWLMGWFVQCYRLSRQRWLIAFSLVCMGVALEGIQSLTPQRRYEFADMIANTIGVSVAFLLANTPLQNILHLLERKLFNVGHT